MTESQVHPGESCNTRRDLADKGAGARFDHSSEDHLMRSYGTLKAIVGLSLLAGCAQSNNSAQSAYEPQPDPSSFDVPKEPELNANTRCAAGQLAEAQGDLPRAIQQYSEALKLEPKHEQSLFRLAVVHAQLKQYPQSIEAWKRYLKVTDGSAIGYSNLGFTYELSGQLAQAEEAYKKGISRDMSSRPCRVNYGLMLARMGRTSEATIQLQSVLKPAEVHYNLASVYEQQGRKEQAKAEYNKALTIDPGLYDARVRLSSLD